MSLNLRSMSLGLLVATVVSVFGATSSYADPHYQPRLRPIVPPPVGSQVVPRLGIMGHVDRGIGMVVESVQHGTPASRMGLERGDVIHRINGREISNDWAYREALIRAAQFDNGAVNLHIIDARTGRHVVRAGFVNANPGVIRPRPVLFGETSFGTTYPTRAPHAW